MHELWDSLIEAKGIIIGTPTYYGNVSSQLKAIMDRCTALVQIQKDGSIKHMLRGKIGAAIAVGGCRNGGQESALMSIIRFFMFCNMFPVGLPEAEDQGLGVAAFGNNPGEVLKDKWKSWLGREVSSPEHARILGRKVAILATSLSVPEIDL
jgi:multimeric flavodoxin WrbA